MLIICSLPLTAHAAILTICPPEPTVVNEFSVKPLQTLINAEYQNGNIPASQDFDRLREKTSILGCDLKEVKKSALNDTDEVDHIDNQNLIADLFRPLEKTLDKLTPDRLINGAGTRLKTAVTTFKNRLLEIL